MSSQNEIVQRLRMALDEAVRSAEDPCTVARLSRVERAVVEILLHENGRRTTTQIRELSEAHLNEPISEGSLKMLLARLTAPEVGILDRSTSGTSEFHLVNSKASYFSGGGRKATPIE